MVIKICALLTVILHYSGLYVDYFSTGSAQVSDTLLLPIYPCHIMMWLLLAVAFIKNKESKVFKVLAEVVFYIGVTGGIIGIVFNEAYANTPDLKDWDILKGLLSHSTMLLGCLYLLVGGYIKIRVTNMFSILVGMAILLVDAIIVIFIFNLAGLEPPNSMFLLEAPYPDFPWINAPNIGVLGVIVGLVITISYEQLFVNKNDRWYIKLKEHLNKDK